MHGSIPDWIPFACLVTNRIVRKPGITRALELIIASSVGGVFSFWLSVHDLQGEVARLSQKVDLHITWASAQVVKRDAQMSEAQLAGKRSDEEILRQLKTINDCLLVRSCVK